MTASLVLLLSFIIFSYLLFNLTARKIRNHLHSEQLAIKNQIKKLLQLKVELEKSLESLTRKKDILQTELEKREREAAEKLKAYLSDFEEETKSLIKIKNHQADLLKAHLVSRMRHEILEIFMSKVIETTKKELVSNPDFLEKYMSHQQESLKSLKTH
jgi:hypothetical protein